MKNKAGRPKNKDETTPKRQVLVNKASLKEAQKAAIDLDVTLSDFIETAINEKLARK